MDGQSFWKVSAVPSIVAKLKRRMQEFDPSQLELEAPWETWEADAKYRDAQRGALKARIDQANAIYDDLVKRTATSSDRQ